MSSPSNANFKPSLIGSVFERKPSSPASFLSTQSKFSKTGFPPVEHRSQKSSAFLKSRNENRRKPEILSERSTQVPLIIPHAAATSTIATAGPGPSTMENQAAKQNGTETIGDWRSQISAENEAKVQAMTEDEREAERQEILKAFGPSVGEILRRAREKREGKKEGQYIALDEVPLTSEREPSPSPIGKLRLIGESSINASPATPLVSSLSRSPSRAGTRPSSPNRASRKLRFAELSPEQVHVYPSAPSSPKKHSMLALPPPDPNSNAISLGTFQGKIQPTSTAEDVELEEGTPEYIRQKYFPSASVNNPDLAWMSSDLDSPPSDQNSDLRFDLSGRPIPLSKTLSLPTHLGLHHHAEGTHAGYTLDDIFLLTRSTVRAQRAVMLDILAGIVKWLREDDGTNSEFEASKKTLLNRSQSETSPSPPLLKRILFAGLEAIPERGVIGVRAMQVVWECVVGRRDGLGDLDDDLVFELGGMEQAAVDDLDLITVLPLEDVLPQFLRLLLSPPDGDLGVDNSSHSSTGSSSKSQATPTQQQILSILTRIATHSNPYADAVVREKGLVEALMKVFLIPPSTETSNLFIPDLSAIRLLSILASASRTNAEVLCEKTGASDALLRFIVLSKHESTLVEIMIFYTVLARYGMYSRVAADAKEAWWKVGDHVTALSVSRSQLNSRLVRVYAALVESWLVCATDPHRTTPSHELLWSQVKGWEWGAGLSSLLVRFCGLQTSTTSLRMEVDVSCAAETVETLDLDYLSTCASIWRSLGAYLEGAKVNGVRGGEDERVEVCLVLKKIFDSSMLRMLDSLIKDFKERLKVGTELDLKATNLLSTILSSVIRLWLGCCPASAPIEGTSPFELPFDAISDLCAVLVGHSLWSQRNIHPLLIRPLTTFLVFFLRLSPRLPGSHPDLWLAQAFSILHTLQRGDEEYASQTISQILSTLTPEWASQRGSVGAPSSVWEAKGGLKDILGPFLNYEVNPERDPYAYIAPLYSSPKSIGMCTTLRVPSSTSVHIHTEWRPLGLPLHSDWTISPINHLLRSGSDHSIFKQSGALPDAWDASETEVVRATLALVRVELELLSRFATSVMPAVGVRKEDIVLGCMEVFMLEHGVGAGDDKAASEGQRSLQEVFKDAIVARQMQELLDTSTIRVSSSSSHLTSTPSPITPPAPLELASLTLLGNSVPFYQFYADFLSLYDSISFSHPLFSRLLLPPTSMLYAADYRKLLWNDYSHLLRGIRVDFGDVITTKGGIDEWMYPVERDPEILGAYIRAIIKYGKTGGLQGFLRFIAVHHIASSLWPDLRRDSAVENVDHNEIQGGKLLRAVVEQGEAEFVREVLRYRQSAPGYNAWLPPRCFQELDETFTRRRYDLIEKWGGPSFLERLRGAFESEANQV